MAGYLYCGNTHNIFNNDDLFNTLIIVLVLLNLCRYCDFVISVVNTGPAISIAVVSQDNVAGYQLLPI
jgi:hypothetical protein